ncbi:MAG: glycosyltransferase [Negativicutes bacterium]|nr:glycosyltransferase [Negativicutes bacterium]
MKILIVGTVNGLQNEGMRNVITHFSKCFKKEHEVIYSALRDIGSSFALAKKSDIVIVCARASAKVYLLCRLLMFRTSRLFVLLVQRPEKWFVRLNNICTLKCDYLTIYGKDSEVLRSGPSRVYEVSVGIDTLKFHPLRLDERNHLKKKYGFDTVRPIVLHVGHCSTGRGLEDFCLIDKSSYQRVVVASGLFEDKTVIDMLHESEVKLLTGFMPNIEELYQIADVYLFPTKTTEYVISIPLSVMEALSCGTPVIAYNQLSSLSYIKTRRLNVLNIIETTLELEQALEDSISHKAEITLLDECKSWDESAQEILKFLKGC